MEKIKRLIPFAKNAILILSIFAVSYLIIDKVLGVYEDEAFLYAFPVTILVIYLYRKHGKQ